MSLTKELAKIRIKLINEKYPILSKNPEEAFEHLYSCEDTLETNMIRISEACVAQYRLFNLDTRRKTNHLLTKLSGLDKYAMEEKIWKSIHQAGKNISGNVFQRQLGFVLRKIDFNVSINSGRDDLIISKNNAFVKASLKISVRDRSNDNECRIKFSYGDTKNKNGGFTREGLEHWIEDNEGKILCIISPQARKQLVSYAKRILGVDLKVYSLDEASEEINNILTKLPAHLNIA